MSRIRSVIILLSVYYFVCCLWPVDCGPVMADSKSWDSGGDDSSWNDSDNWHPAAVPVIADDIIIDYDGASVLCDATFRAKSVTIGGRETSEMTSDNFVYGLIEPDMPSEVAILNRRGGHIILKGAGTLTLKGEYKDSEAGLGAEPSFMFWVE